jgi:hypothetical protein
MQSQRIEHLDLQIVFILMKWVQYDYLSADALEQVDIVWPFLAVVATEACVVNSDGVTGLVVEDVLRVERLGKGDKERGFTLWAR